MPTSADVRLMRKEPGFDIIRFAILPQGTGPGAELREAMVR